MSAKIVSKRKYNDLEILWAIRDIPKSILNSQKKGILAMLLACIGNNESCNYSVLHLENKLGMSDKNLRAHLLDLESLDFLIIKRPDNYVKGETNSYSLNYEHIVKIAGSFRSKNTCDKE